MNLIWVKHVVFSLTTTAVCVAAMIALIFLIGLRFPAGLDDAMAYFGIFLAALICVLAFMPEIEDTVAIASTIYGKVILSIMIAIAGAVGGGIIRRIILGETTILGQPLNPWWIALFSGWAAGFALCQIRFNVYTRFPLVKKGLNELDAWIMGAFAAGGAFAAAPWRPVGEYSSNIFVQMLAAAFFAMISGAGGGLIARIIADTAFGIGIRKSWKVPFLWAISTYVQVAFGVGLLAYTALRAVLAVIVPQHLAVKEFIDRSFDCARLIAWQDAQWWPSVRSSIDLLLSTDVGVTLSMSVLAGFAGCYMYRNANAI